MAPYRDIYHQHSLASCFVCVPGENLKSLEESHEGWFWLHPVLGNHLMNTNRHGLKFDYVMGNGMHEWTQVLILPVH